MSIANDHHNSKQQIASSWNALRSKVVPSGVSGSHKTAASSSSAVTVRAQTSDETIAVKASKAPLFYENTK